MMNGRSTSADTSQSRLDDDARVSSQWRPLILTVLILALVLRLLAAVFVERHVQGAGRRFFVEGDADGYWHLGRAVAHGEDYAVHVPPRRVLRVPGFPLLLAGCIHLFGDHVFPARCVLAVVGVACCWLTWRLGRRLVMQRVGFWAALLVAVNPLHVGNSVLILSENWFTFWMLASLLALMNLIDSRKISTDHSRLFDAGMAGRSALTGGLIAMAVLVKPGFALWLAVAVTAVLLLSKRDLRVRFAQAAVMVTAFGAMMLPWTARNYNVTGHWVLTSLWSGPSLYDGLNPHADGSSDMQFFDRDNIMSVMTEYEMNTHYQRLALQFVQEHPGQTLSLAGHKLVRFLQPVPNSVSAGWAVWAVCGVAGAAFLSFCLVGIRSGILEPTGLVVTLGPFLLFMVVHMVFVGSLRYRLPTEFPLAISAAVGLRQMLIVRKQG